VTPTTKKERPGRGKDESQKGVRAVGGVGGWGGGGGVEEIDVVIKAEYKKERSQVLNHPKVRTEDSNTKQKSKN